MKEEDVAELDVRAVAKEEEEEVEHAEDKLL